jgi:hypothetical protein
MVCIFLMLCPTRIKGMVTLINLNQVFKEFKCMKKVLKRLFYMFFESMSLYGGIYCER